MPLVGMVFKLVNGFSSSRFWMKALKAEQILVGQVRQLQVPKRYQNVTERYVLQTEYFGPPA